MHLSLRRDLTRLARWGTHSQTGPLIGAVRRIGGYGGAGMLIATSVLGVGSFTQTAAAFHICADDSPPPACQPRPPHVVQFDANSIIYNTAAAVITVSGLEQLDSVTNINRTTVLQSTTISGQRMVTNTQGWSDTFGQRVTVSGSLGIPFVSNGTISVEGSASFTHNGTSSEAQTFAWQQPVLVPAKSRVVMTVAVARTTIVVPYTMSGTFLYSDGQREPGLINGTYTGTNSHDLEVTLAQFNLDGTPAAQPVAQPAATLLAIS